MPKSWLFGWFLLSSFDTMSGCTHAHRYPSFESGTNMFTLRRKHLESKIH